MKFFLAIISLFTFSSCTTKVPVMQEKHAKNVSFNSVWNQVISDPLETLPQNKVSYSKLKSKGKDNIMNDSVRTLSDHSDILEYFEKLAHPNGICFKGVWKIDTKNIFGGYFQKGSEALIIARASSALSNTKHGKIRSFGFAGKLFPTLKPEKRNSENSANFFLIDDLGGTKARYKDVSLSNEPSISMNKEMLKNLFYALKLSRTFSKVDKHAGIRQLYEISYLSEEKNTNILTPKWMKIEQETPLNEADDFRDALSITENKSLVFNIHVASKMIGKNKDWIKVGTITLDTSVVSTSCDHRLHFHHPLWRDDLNYTIPK